MVLIISMTIGSLVLDGWHLNLTEATLFSVAAGLSADFTLHYSVAYRTSSRNDKRQERVARSLEHVGAPIIMGAITTFIGGNYNSSLSFLLLSLCCYHSVTIILLLSFCYSHSIITMQHS